MIDTDNRRGWAAWHCITLLLTLAPPVAGQTGGARRERLIPRSGSVSWAFDTRLLEAWNLSVVSRHEGVETAGIYRDTLDLEVNSSSFVVERADGDFNGIHRATFPAYGALLIGHDGRAVALSSPTVRTDDSGSWWVATMSGGPRDERVAFRLTDVTIDFVAAAGRLRIAGGLVIADTLAKSLGVSDAAGTVVGHVRVDAKRFVAERTSGWRGHRGGIDGAAASGLGGADVIVGDLPDINSYGSEGQMAAFAVATTSCNIGDVPLSWFDSTPDHPVIGQSLYRLRDDRFEQIGQGWLKHGFFALALNQCALGCDDPGTGTLLGVGCSDPYSAGLNGSQPGLGPRSEVNAYTGEFPFPPQLRPPIEDLTTRRLRVTHSDLDPALDGGGLYFVEGQYVTPDDAAAGNQNNNSSYRRVEVSFSESLERWQMFPTETTQRQQAAIRAWQDTDDSVTETEMPVPGEGLFILAAKPINLGSGNWRYEYALQNITSDRSAQSFSIPTGAQTIITEAGFHDVAYHSGEPYDGTDWVATVADGRITWSTEAHGVNPNANALRWGTLYSFHFVADAPPQPTLATCGLFKPGTPGTVSATTVGPTLDPKDCNVNEIPDACDVSCDSQACLDTGWTGQCGGEDCNGNLQPDACDVARAFSQDCNASGTPDECDVVDGTSGDCNANAVPDECELPDCDGNGIPDSCDLADGTSPDCNGDGLLDACARPVGPLPFDPAALARNRYLTFSGTDRSRLTAVRVSFTNLPPPNDAWNGTTMWVGEPRAVSELGGENNDAPPTFTAASLECAPFYADWGTFGTINAYHQGIVPSGTYELDVLLEGCDPDSEHSFSAPQPITLAPWGDAVGRFEDGAWSPPDGTVDIPLDIVAIINKFGSLPGSPAKSRVDLEPATPDQKINISDVTFALDAFRSLPYPFDITDSPCP